jgi:hypothetical protein
MAKTTWPCHLCGQKTANKLNMSVDVRPEGSTEKITHTLNDYPFCEKHKGEVEQESINDFLKNEKLTRIADPFNEN